MSTRFTITDLRNIIEVCNQRLEQNGCLVRVEEFHRNGCYGTEYYPIDDQGNRAHSGSSYIESGSARSVARKTEAWAYQQINKQENQFKAGQLAYLDTLCSGLVPCKVLEVVEPGSGKYATTGNIKVRVTAKRRGYFVGCIVKHNAASKIIPRSHVRKSGSGHRINVNYNWI